MLLSIPLCNESCYVFAHFTIFIELDFINLFYSNYLSALKQFCYFPCVVPSNCLHFYIHGFPLFLALDNIVKVSRLQSCKHGQLSFFSRNALSCLVVLHIHVGRLIIRFSCELDELSSLELLDMVFSSSTSMFELTSLPIEPTASSSLSPQSKSHAIASPYCYVSQSRIFSSSNTTS